MHDNYKFKYKSRKKWVFVPAPACDRKAEHLLAWGATLDLPDYFFHYRPGGHVDALHKHLERTHFFRVDLKNFFYSIARNRVARVLRQYSFPRNARDYAEWSTVKSPYDDGPRYVLPIGFMQSPLLASLALYRSSVASAIEEAQTRGVFVSVYFDDLIGSADNPDELRTTYEGILAACAQANLVANVDKLIAPAEAIVAFNCDLKHGEAVVTDERIERFMLEDRGPIAEASFLEYCRRVQRRNHAA
jgi:hypothetical protein